MAWESVVLNKLGICKIDARACTDIRTYITYRHKKTTTVTVAAHAHRGLISLEYTHTIIIRQHVEGICVHDWHEVDSRETCMACIILSHVESRLSPY